MSRHVRVQKRFASSAAKLATVPLSQIPKFPPKGAASHPPSGTPSASTKWGDWDPHTWSELQPPPRSALTALRHRVGLGNVLSDEELELACTHPSYLPFYAKHNPDKQALQANGNLATLGNSLLGLFASEFLHTSYPHLPTRVLKAAVSAYVGPQTCANVAKEIGAAPLLRWRRTVRDLVPYCLFCLTEVLFIAAKSYATTSIARERSLVNTTRTDSSRLPTTLRSDRTRICTRLLPQPRCRHPRHAQVHRPQTESH